MKTFKEWHGDAYASEGFPVPAGVFYSRLNQWVDIRYN